MTFTPEDFDIHLDKWKDWPTTPWNRLLYSTCHRNLLRYLGKPPLKILDAGGGNGEDTFFLVQQGHSVTLQDFSAEMLADARQRAAERGSVEQITFCQADVAELPTLFQAETFDAILCHNMIKFVMDGYALLDDLYGLLKPGGLLSITAVNPHSEAFRQAIFLDDLAEALVSIGQEQHLHPWFNKPEKRHTPEALIAYLERQGCTLLGHFGLRNIVDYLTDNESKFNRDYFERLEALEHAMTDQYPYYLLARMFQIIVQK
ncbi:methyltransferase domain-containing protein [Chloroflexota bacterium]